MTEKVLGLYFEDLQVGDKFSSGKYEFTKSEIVDFAKKFDPQPFHLSDDGAKNTIFGMAASGWHRGGTQVPYSDLVKLRYNSYYKTNNYYAVI